MIRDVEEGGKMQGKSRFSPRVGYIVRSGVRAKGPGPWRMRGWQDAEGKVRPDGSCRNRACGNSAPPHPDTCHISHQHGQPHLTFD